MIGVDTDPPLTGVLGCAAPPPNSRGGDMSVGVGVDAGCVCVIPTLRVLGPPPRRTARRPRSSFKLVARIYNGMPIHD